MYVSASHPHQGTHLSHVCERNPQAGGKDVLEQTDSICLRLSAVVLLNCDHLEFQYYI